MQYILITFVLMSVSTLKDALNRLKKYNNSPAPILSVYFQLPDSHRGDSVLFQLCSKLMAHDLSKEQIKIAGKNLEYILGFIKNYQKKGNEQSLALFSGGDSLFEIIYLPYKIKNAAFFSHSPVLEPILEEESVYRRYLVILMDREKARFFTITQRLVERSGELFDPSVPQNVHADTDESENNAREDKINRHIQDHIHRHFKKIVQTITQFIGNDIITGVIIGGHKNLFQKFEHHLPKNLQDKIMGEFVTELNNNTNKVILRSLQLIEEIDKKINEQHSPFIHH